MELLEYGKVVKCHGLKGELKVFPYSSDPSNFQRLNTVYIYPEDGQKGYPLAFEIEKKRIQKNHIIVKLKGIDTLQEAEKLVKKSIYITTDLLEETQQDEYYWYQLIGLDVYTSKGEQIGRVKNLMETPAYDILIINSEEKEILIPFNEVFVENVDLEKSKIVTNPIKGLLD